MSTILMLLFAGLGLAALAGTLADDEPDAIEREDDTLLGTDGDDSLTGGDLLQFEDSQEGGLHVIDLQGGDDSLSVQDRTWVGDGATILGGGGNDYIDFTDTTDTNSAYSIIYDSSIDGGAGNDTIHSGHVNHVFGGAGDDVLTYAQGDGLGDYSTGIADGGEGNDTITMSEVIGWNNNYDTTGVRVSGGSGADSIVIELLDDVGTVDDDFGGTIETDGGEQSQIHLQDFNATEDSLTIDVSSFTETGNLTYQNAGLTETGAGSYRLDLNFSAGLPSDPFVISVLIDSVGTVAIDDITVVA